MASYVRKAFSLVVIRRGIRELLEEAGIKTSPAELNQVGELEFTFEGESTLMHVHIFSPSSYTGTPTETEEMRPKWFPVAQIPYPEMWPDDILWYPIFLKGGKFRGAFHFKGHDQILSQHLEEVDTLGKHNTHTPEHNTHAPEHNTHASEHNTHAPVPS